MTEIRAFGTAIIASTDGRTNFVFYELCYHSQSRVKNTCTVFEEIEPLYLETVKNFTS